MTLCLNGCLRAVGLQHHYARFTSMGIHRAAHLSALTMEDYHILGIHTMEDRARLFHLVQMVKTLDLDNLGNEDGDDNEVYGADGGDEGYTGVDSNFNLDGCGDPDEDVFDDDEYERGHAMNMLNATTFAEPSCVRRRLDFSCETTDHKLLSCPVGCVHTYESHKRNDGSVQGKGSVIALQLDSGAPVVCGCKGNNHRADAHRHPSNHHTGGNTNPDIMGGVATYQSHTRLSPKCVPSHKQKPRPVAMTSNRINNKAGWHKDRERTPKKEKLFTEAGGDGASGDMAESTPVYKLKRTTGYSYGLPRSSPRTPNKKQEEGEQRISVCVRKRPLTRAENRKGEADVVTTAGGECVVVHESKEAVDLTQYILQHRFYFDQVFGEDSSNEDVYQRTAYPLVQHMLRGGKATCFAYGQTGAGKTHTMLGSSHGRPGLYALAVRDIFAHLSTAHMHSPECVYVSFFEIYCGQLYDLLDHRKRLFAREDGQRVVHIAGLHDVRVDSVSSLLEVISQGMEERTQGTSGVNPLSSRSHALLQIQLRGPNQQIAGRMWFVDLAGSERASDTKEPDRQSRMEGAEINQSLLALKECIRSLDQEQSHTPFRQSKLTQVLKDSFVGDSMTCMIANISPGHLATEHTLNTLRYADRVKELRGQGGLRGGRRGKTTLSAKHNLRSSNSSSFGTRGKSPPKKQKLGRQREYFDPTTPNGTLARVDAMLCSTPKYSKWGTDTSARGRKETGFERITPVRGWLGTGDKRHRREEVGERGDRRRENERYGRTNSHAVSDQDARAGLMPGQPTDEWLHMREVQKSVTQRESRIYHREIEKQQSTTKGGREEERWIQQRSQVESSDTCSQVERLREGDLQRADEKDKDRQRHLRRYHQQLQQFVPSSASSSISVSPPSTCPPMSSSNQACLSSSVSPSSRSSLRHSTHLSASALMCHGLKEVLYPLRAEVEVKTDGNRGQFSFPSADMCLQTEPSPSCNNDNDGDAHCDAGGVGEDWRISWERTGARFGQGKGESERRGAEETTGEGRVRREEGRPAGLDVGERRWAWVATTEKEQTNRTTGAIPTNVAAQVSYSCHSEDRRHEGEEELNLSNALADVMWSTEGAGGASSYGLVSTHSSDDSNNGFHCPPFESPHQRAAAERPLSPAREHISTLPTPDKLGDLSLESKCNRFSCNILPLPLRNAQFSNAQSSTPPFSTANLQTGCQIPAELLNRHNFPEVKAKVSVLPQDESCADSLSYIMDPLSISLLQVDQQVATASFIRGEQNNTSHCVSENGKEDSNRREVGKENHACPEIVGKVVKDSDMEFCPSLLELPQKKAGLQDQVNGQKPETMPAHGNKGSASPLKPLTRDSVQNSAVQPVSPCVMYPGNTNTHNSHNPVTNGATQMPTGCAHKMHNRPASSISTPQSESVLGHSHTANSNRSSELSSPLQPNCPAESHGQERTSNQQIRPVSHLSTLEDMTLAQWRVVQAHWEELEEMEALWHKEGTLLCQQPDMAFRDYVHKLEEIMERKARCVHSMRAQLQPYLRTSLTSQPNNKDDDA